MGRLERSLVCTLFIFVFSFFTSPVDAARIDIKITTVQMKHQQMGVGIERLSRYIQANLKDKVRVRTYPAAQLYTGQEEIQAVMKGEIQMAYVIGAALEPVDPSLELIKLPFIFPDIEVSYKVLEGLVSNKLFAKLGQRDLGVLGMVSSGEVLVSNSKRPIKSTDDFKAIKMRSCGPMGAATLKALGAIPVVTASEETYSALQQGVIEGTLTPAVVFLARKYYDVQKFVTGAGMLNAVHVFIIVNKTWWEKLPPDIRAGINSAAVQLVKEQRAEIIAEGRKTLQDIAAKGCQVHMLSQAEQQAFRKILQSVYTEFSPKIGNDLVRETQQEVERLSRTKQ
jgi:C4-dicarboxylate-binding protein DctP